MKHSFLILYLLTYILLSCSKSSNSPEFIEQVTGRYLYNSDEIIEVYFQNEELFIKWHGANKIHPLKLDEQTFFVKEMNEKVRFLINPDDQTMYFSLVPKDKDQPISYNFKKLNNGELTPSEYFKNKDFEKALQGYLDIQRKDSLDSNIVESDFNSKGYSHLRKGHFNEAIQIFKINVALYPDSPNVYDSLGEAFMKSGDTISAIDNYKKSLALNSGNKNAKKQLKRLEKKGSD